MAFFFGLLFGRFSLPIGYKGNESLVIALKKFENKFCKLQCNIEYCRG